MNYLFVHTACHNYGGMADQRQKHHRLVQLNQVTFVWDYMYAKKLNVCMHELNSIKNKQWQALAQRSTVYSPNII